MEERLMRVLRWVVYRLKRIGPRTEPTWYFKNERFRREMRWDGNG